MTTVPEKVAYLPEPTPLVPPLPPEVTPALVAEGQPKPPSRLDAMTVNAAQGWPTRDPLTQQVVVSRQTLERAADAISRYIEVCHRDLARLPPELEAVEAHAASAEARRDAVLRDEVVPLCDIGNGRAWVEPSLRLADGRFLEQTSEYRRYTELSEVARRARAEATAASYQPGKLRHAIAVLGGRLTELHSAIAWWDAQQG